ncbi:MAG: SirB2 family protein [Oceanobacter sp.]
MDYMTVKHAHAGLAYLSALLFLIRFGLVYAESGLMKIKLIKILPHVIDTALVLLAIWLCFLIQQYPVSDHWLTAKVVALVVLVGSGVVAIKRRSIPAAILTLALYGYMIGVAKTHSILSWVALS